MAYCSLLQGRSFESQAFDVGGISGPVWSGGCLIGFICGLRASEAGLLMGLPFRPMNCCSTLCAGSRVQQSSSLKIYEIAAPWIVFTEVLKVPHLAIWGIYESWHSVFIAHAPMSAITN